MQFDQLEVIYERLAIAIDEAGDSNRSLFLTKLVLRLSWELGNQRAVLSAIDDCKRDI
jgi:hypothetical protein